MPVEQRKWRARQSNKSYRTIYIEDEIWDKLTVIADDLGFSRNRVVAETLEKGLEIET